MNDHHIQAWLQRRALETDLERVLAAGVGGAEWDAPVHPNGSPFAQSPQFTYVPQPSGCRRRITFLRERDGDHCYLCGASLEPGPVAVDHVAPRAHGGTDDDYNLALTCPGCNQEKSDKVVSFRVDNRQPVFGRPL